MLTPYRDNGHLEVYQHNFNFKLSSARVYVERAFGILKGKFRKLKYLEVSDLELGNQIISACCILHNIIREENAEDDEIKYHYSKDYDTPELPEFSNVNTAAKNKREFIASSL